MVDQLDNWRKAGGVAATTAHKLRNGSIRAYMEAIDQSTPEGKEYAKGVLLCAVGIVGRMLEYGTVINGAPPSISMAVDTGTLKLSLSGLITSGDADALTRFNTIIINLADQWIRDGIVSFNPDSTPPVAEDSGQPHVTIINHIQPSAIGEVSIVSMPERVTTTAVERDKNGNIKTTTQTERDAA